MKIVSRSFCCLLCLLCASVAGLAQTTIDDLTYVINDDNTTVTVKAASKSLSGRIYIPAQVTIDETTYRVTDIGRFAFDSCNDLTSVSIANGVTTIGYSAFGYCPKLESVTIPNSVVKIDQCAFMYCEKLKSVVIPEKITDIALQTFYGCSSLTSVSIPESVTSIGYRAFYTCTSLSSVTLPSSLTSIEERAFDSCTALTYIEIPESVTNIGIEAFQNCTSLFSIVIPNTSINIEDGAFNGCSKMSRIILPDRLSKLGDNLFSNCEKLKSVTIPEFVTSIGMRTFYSCKSLQSISIPNSVTEIGPSAFSSCDNLSNVLIGKSVNKISDYAFGSSTIKIVKCLSKEPPTLGTQAFRLYIPDNRTLYVPNGSLSAYNNSDWAQYFTTIEELARNLCVKISGNGKVYDAAFKPVENESEFEGSDFAFNVIPADGHYISSITLEGVDILNNLANHNLTICGFTGEGDGVLNIEFAPEGEATLTVRGADNHSVTHTYKEGTKAKILLNPEYGWQIHSASYNGEDATDRIVNNEFITEPLHGDNNLNFVLINDNLTEVENLNTPNPVQISTLGNNVIVSGVADGDTVSVYDISGKTIYTGFDKKITLEAGNVYLLTTGKQTFKIFL